MRQKLIEKILEGEKFIQDIIWQPENDFEKEFGKELAELWELWSIGLHGDDDFERIEERVKDRLEEEIENNLN